MPFTQLGLSQAITKAVSLKGYTQPSPIQAKAIPQVLQRKDVLASAQTGTGKTAGFTLPILELLSQKQNNNNRRQIRALILTPTRELAAQILENIHDYSKFVDIKSMVIFGGVNANPQISKLRQGVDILVATPGRLLDLHNQKVFSLQNIDILVLDEADRMLDMGFQRDINKIMTFLPKKRQNLLFSATFSKEIKQLASKFLVDPVLVEATPENTTAEKVEQLLYHVNKVEKASILTKLIKEGDWSQVLVFTRTKHGANKLSEKLEKAGISSAAIHGNKSQAARTKALAGFKDNKIRVLVATDIAARGLDIPLLPHVVNYELPNVPEDYVHRIGRTGRAGESGMAISLVSHDEKSYVRGIEKLLGFTLQYEIIEGFEPSKTPPPEEPKQQGGRRNFDGNRNSNNNRPKNNSFKPKFKPKGGFNRNRSANG